jgi:hypothetical protein
MNLEIPLTISLRFFMGWALKELGSSCGYSGLLSSSSRHNLIPPSSFGSQSLSMQRILYFIMGQPLKSTKNLN